MKLGLTAPTAASRLLRRCSVLVDGTPFYPATPWDRSRRKKILTIEGVGDEKTFIHCSASVTHA